MADTSIVSNNLAAATANASTSFAPALLTRQAVASRLAVSVPTVDRLIGRRELRAVRIGRAVRVRPSDLERFIGRLAEVR